MARLLRSSAAHPRGGVAVAVRWPCPNLVVISIAGDVELAGSARLQELLRHRMAGLIQAVVVDLSAVRFINSVGAELLCGCAQRAEARGMALRVVADQSGRTRRVLALTGLADRFQFCSDVASAVAELAPVATGST